MEQIPWSDSGYLFFERKRVVARRKGLTFYQKKKRLNPRIIKDVLGMRTRVIGDSLEPVL